MLDLPGSRPKRDPDVLARIKAWTQNHLGPDPEASVMVTELRCTEPGCPPLETVIAILSGSGANRQHKIHKPMDEVTEADVADCARDSDHDHLHGQKT